MESPDGSQKHEFRHHTGRLFHYAPKLVAFEFQPPFLIPASRNAVGTDTLIFIGGLFDGLLTVPYVPALAERLPSNWRLVQPILSSSYTGWGTCSLDTDVAELEQLISYLKILRPDGAIVLLGHSTGCQDALHYLLAPPRPHASGVINGNPGGQLEGRYRPAVDGIVLQAPVSDREALRALPHPHEFDALCKLAATWVDENRGEEVLPRGGQYGTARWFGDEAAITARRFLSLASPGPAHAGQDDYFSSDFSNGRLVQIFGRIPEGMRVLVVCGSEDEHVPYDVDSVTLLRRWRDVITRRNIWVDPESCVLEGADHNLSKCGDIVRDQFIRKVWLFLDDITRARKNRACGGLQYDKAIKKYM